MSRGTERRRHEPKHSTKSDTRATAGDSRLGSATVDPCAWRRAIFGAHSRDPALARIESRESNRAPRRKSLVLVPSRGRSGAHASAAAERRAGHRRAAAFPRCQAEPMDRSGRGRPVSIRIMSKVWELDRYELGARLVLLALADWCDDTGYCWPKVESIAKKTRLQVRQVQNILSRFKTDGTISIERGGGRGKGNCYQLHLERVQSSAPFNAEETVQSVTERVQSSTQKGAIHDSAIRKEPSLEPSIEPSAVFKVPTPEAPAQKPLVPFDQNCPDCRGDGLVFPLIDGWRRARRCQTCRGPIPQNGTDRQTPQKRESMAVSA
jgi:hypothetical protein